MLEKKSTAQLLADELRLMRIESDRKMVELMRVYDGEKASFSLFIHQAIARHDLSQSGIARLTKATTSDVFRYANGAAPPRFLRRQSIILKLADFIEERVSKQASRE